MHEHSVPSEHSSLAVEGLYDSDACSDPVELPDLGYRPVKRLVAPYPIALTVTSVGERSAVACDKYEKRYLINGQSIVDGARAPLPGRILTVGQRIEAEVSKAHFVITAKTKD